MQVYIYNGQITTYLITTNGLLFNTKTNKWLKGQVNKFGYHTYNISIDGKKKRLYAHRMVAETYLTKPKDKTEVNHKDGNKLNNDAENLEWVTSSENQRHRHSIGIKQTSNRYIGMFNSDNKLVKDFNSIIEAAAFFNKTSRVNIDNVLQGKQKSAYGYFWKYLD